MKQKLVFLANPLWLRLCVMVGEILLHIHIFVGYKFKFCNWITQSIFYICTQFRYGMVNSILNHLSIKLWLWKADLPGIIPLCRFSLVKVIFYNLPLPNSNMRRFSALNSSWHLNIIKQMTPSKVFSISNWPCLRIEFFFSLTFFFSKRWYFIVFNDLSVLPLYYM